MDFSQENDEITHLNNESKVINTEFESGPTIAFIIMNLSNRIYRL
jgi:hypothetical protein